MISIRALLLSLGLVLGVASTSHAILFGGFEVRVNRPFCGPRRAPTYAERYYYSNQAYPKYYYGFHANYFQSLGLPPGDIGLRTNGIYPTAW